MGLGCLVRFENPCLRTTCLTIHLRKGALSLDPYHPQACFIRETLDKEIRLSYYEHIQKSVAEEFRPEEPKPNFEYSVKDHPLHQHANKALESLRYRKKKGTDEEEEEEVVRETLQQIKEDQNSEEVAREIFIQCLLEVGCKSFSHMLSAVER